MATVRPFRGVRYQPLAGPIGDLITEPYDKITPAMHREYLAQSPHSVVRLILSTAPPAAAGPAPGRYEESARLYERWRAAGVLARDARAGVYRYRQEFAPPGSAARRTRTALIGRVRLVPFESGIVRPHEKTLAAPKADRLALLRATGVHFGQIFMLYDDADGQVRALLDEQGEPLERFSDRHDIRHELHRLSAEAGTRLAAALADRPLYIADGHHRYETALAYAQEHAAAGPDAPAAYVMASLVAFDDPGLCVLPTHRLVHGLPDFRPEQLLSRLAPWFEALPARGVGELQELLDTVPRGIGMSTGVGRWLLAPRASADLSSFFHDQPALWRDSDVALLHLALLEPCLGIDAEALSQERNIHYERDAAAADKRITAGEAQALFILRPTPPAFVRAIADARSRMPQKSTDFYPKLPTGLVMYDTRDRHDDSAAP